MRPSALASPPTAIASPLARRRIIFVGPLVAGGTSLQRLRTFELQGHRVLGIDTLPAPWSRLALTLPYRAFHRLGGPYDLALANRALLAIDPAFGPDVVWIEKGVAIEVATLRALAARWPRAVLLNYSGDDMFNPRNQSRQWRACLPVYDLHVTTKRHNVPELIGAGARDVFQLDKGFDLAVHRPMPVTPEVRARFGGDVGFVGWPEAERARSMRYLAENGVRVRVWGPWPRWAGTHADLRIEGRPLWGDDYANALSAFRINLCFLRKANRDRHTARSVEIPACGGFMLAERTEEHQALFEEGREAVYFESDAELLARVRHSLTHEDERARIAAAGRQRCLTGGYSYDHRLTQVLEYVAARHTGTAHAKEA